MKKILFAFGMIAILVTAIAVTKGEAILLSMRAALTPKQSLIALQSQLEPNLIVTIPTSGTGPFPVVFQFHGCAGARQPFQEMWARIANDAGYAAVIVDSNRPRGMNRETALQQVCGGKTLIGQERAGDILAAIDLVRKRTDIDADHIVLTGWSHGAWTIMDFLTLAANRAKPAALESFKESTPQIDGAVLFYPYCGIGALSRIKNWQQTPQVLALIAGADTVVDHRQCLTRFDKLRAKGVKIDEVVYPDTEHAFDDLFIEPDWQHWHNPENMRDAMQQYRSFLNGLNPKSGV